MAAPFYGRKSDDGKVAIFGKLGQGSGLVEVVGPVLAAGSEGLGGAGDGAGHVRERAHAVQVLVLGHEMQLARTPVLHVVRTEPGLREVEWRGGGVRNNRGAGLQGLLDHSWMLGEVLVDALLNHLDFLLDRFPNPVQGGDGRVVRGQRRAVERIAV